MTQLALTDRADHRRHVESRKEPRASLLELLELARWAPSGDNRQPWRVRALPEGLAISLDDGPIGFLDQGPATAIALGAFAESCRLAAERWRIPAEVHADEVRDGRAFVALGKTGTGSLPNDALGKLLPLRCTNRRLYAPNSCTAAELRQLAAEVDDLPAVRLSFATGGDLAPLSRAVAATEKVRLRHRRCHQEFHAKVRWTAEEAEADPTGFWVDTFEIKPHERWMLRATRHWGVNRAVDTFLRVGDLAAAVVQRQVQHAGAVAILTLPEQAPLGWATVGRALQRIWLRATALGLSGQVLGVTPIFLQKLRAGGEDFTPRQQRQLQRAGELLGAMKDGPRPDELAMMLRLGRAPSPTARAGRLPAAVLIDSTTS